MATILITDTDNWIINKEFQYLLWFQPTLWWILIKKTSIYIYLDNRYFNYSKQLNKKEILEKVEKENIYFKRFEWKLINDILAECSNSNFLKLEETLNLKYFNEINDKSNLWIYLNPKKTEIIKNYFGKNRIIKNKWEIVKIKKAIEIIENVFIEIQKLNSEWKIIWKTEREIRKFILQNIINFGWTWESFDSIVAFWINSAVPHHQTWDTIISNWPLLIDMWAIYEWYSSDFTRNIWVWEKNINYNLDSKKIENYYNYNEFENIYNIVKTAHDKAREKIKSWILVQEIDKTARDYISDNWYWEYFTHSTWHWVWLNIHEPPFINKSSNEIIQKWMVFTIEPWIYLEWKFGIRYENIFFVN